MKILRIIKKSIKDAFKSVFRNFSLSMASISCTAITLILVAIAIVVTDNVNYMTKNFESKLSIVTYVDPKTKNSDVEKLIYEINSLKNVNQKETIYKSSDEIASEIKDENIKLMLETLDKNPLSSKIFVKVEDINYINETADSISKLSNVINVEYGKSFVDKLIPLFKMLRNGCVVAVVALVFVTAFLIANTIKITIFSRRNEINIMRLVGTSNTVIKLPFIIEGFILGIIGAIVPILLTIYGYSFIHSYLGGELINNQFPLVDPKNIVYSTSLVVLLVGGIVGMFGSLRAVKKYLKV